ncbi:hypothetical protein AAAC13_00930 [Pseudomonas aeruginosa]|uniref:hypothetical protein n=1 Tax=Pseudomonas aeruginosa group TaxID=136841 RepID=UPI00071B1BF9|nr:MULTISPECIES: hypothetical protein [Pseudomonas aeruginosa group]EIU1446669.1 hypothetical protein [Pseudomonas aeruginosa]EKV2978010.1 hypothetical protein [Pseudomonas aeruginosa]EKV3164705.1 hypothetical protein [Pseudomonas aeruginosa]EKW6216193.1 hypothetical protein [Pseudomonas aeruginosa]EKW7605878.1 hypothetical protein [Pseudomonas aeruginosa]
MALVLTILSRLFIGVVAVPATIIALILLAAFGGSVEDGARAYYNNVYDLATHPAAAPGSLRILLPNCIPATKLPPDLAERPMSCELKRQDRSIEALSTEMANLIKFAWMLIATLGTVAALLWPGLWRRQDTYAECTPVSPNRTDLEA